MGTDPEPTMKNKSDQQLVDIDKKYIGFIHVSGLLVFKVKRYMKDDLLYLYLQSVVIFLYLL